MNRLPVLAFCALVLATIAAFFITQHLKATSPLIAGFPRPVPAVIDPLAPAGKTCNGLNVRRMHISFYLLHRSDTVDVWVVNSSGAIVATLATNRHMRRKVRTPDGQFSWNGVQDDGRLAPDGVYYIRVALLQQGRTIEITDPTTGRLQGVTVDTRAPTPRILTVRPQLVSPGGRVAVAIRYTGTEGRGASILLYRTDLPGPPRLAKRFGTIGGSAVWDGRISRRPAPAGVYLVGLRVTDAACNVGRYPRLLPPPPGSTPRAGVTVRYLSAQPPLDPVLAGGRATVLVYAAGHRYRWSISLSPGRVVASGSSSSRRLRVPLPRSVAGLYTLILRADVGAATVPVVVHAARPERVLVVLPALTWVGDDPVDEDGDGVPDTLASGQAVAVGRPLTTEPAGMGDELRLLAYLSSARQRYDLTTDLGLIDGVGPRLLGHRLVILAGTERWATSALQSSLRAYVRGGGRLLSLGIGSLLRSVTISGARLLDPSGPASSDPFAARLGAVQSAGSAPLLVIEDVLGIFSEIGGELRGFRFYQPISPVSPPATILSGAGADSNSLAVVGYRLGSGLVVDIGLPGFGSALARDPGARRLMAGVLGALAH